MSFSIDPTIEAVSVPLTRLTLCEARLMKDARFVWIVLIPRREGLVEIGDLSRDDRIALMDEAVLAGEAVHAIGAALQRAVYKLNTAALGNITRQLHVHVIGRRQDDAAWPRPVWGVGAAEPWSRVDIARISDAWNMAVNL